MTRSSFHDRCSRHVSSSRHQNHSSGNVLSLLARREISPRTKHVPKLHWNQENFRHKGKSIFLPKHASRDSKRGLISWIEAESLLHLSAKYCPLVPSPRSTIAAAFSPDGRTFASTHGDHTVKIIDCQTGNCLKVLSGHRRTPWVVRFHPLHPEILASGSLDYELRLWNARTSECIGSHDFYRPIASLAFHSNGKLLAVASGHKLYMWYYNEAKSLPSVIYKTRRSLRAVHFHPHAAPFLLTAEVNDLDSSDTIMASAISVGYVRYSPPPVYVATMNSRERGGLGAEPPVSTPMPNVPSSSREDSGIYLQHANTEVGSSTMQVESAALSRRQTNPEPSEQIDNAVSPMEIFSEVPDAAADSMQTDEAPLVGESELGSSANHNIHNSVPIGAREQVSTRLEFSEFRQLHQFLPFRDPTSWEIPFLQGLLMGQSHANNRENLSQYVDPSSLTPAPFTDNVETPVASSAVPSGEVTAPSVDTHAGPGNQPISSRIQSELANSLAAAAATELPCTVKLIVWHHCIEDSCALLTAEKCRLIIPHAVLCSEMGAHFSPCGRFLAACVACVLPHVEVDPGSQSIFREDPEAATSPTRHPISAHQVVYELRIYSLEEASFGSVLVSRAIRAAHCLTSIQFSPTSEHILLAYGRRHGSLLKSIVIDGETTSPIYTVLEIYRVCDMELVRILHSAEDEVNVACFHPFAGGGLIYGTKEGKLRVLQYDEAKGTNSTGPCYYPNENIPEVPTYALEG